VVDDPAMAAGAAQLRGEWKAQTGCELEVEPIASKDLAPDRPLPADVTICPSRFLGDLAEGQLLAPVPKEIRQGGGEPWSDIFELLRQREGAWGTQVFAVPLGAPLLTCYYRADLLERLARRPPKTWDDYQELSRLLADRKGLGDAVPPADAPWSGVIEPLGPGWAAMVFLARAAPYAKHRDNFSTLFDLKTMEPRVAGPPMVRALEELCAVARLGAAEGLKFDPASAREAFWQGRCGITLSWPSAAADLAAPVDKRIPVGFVALPGSKQVYGTDRGVWEARTEADGLQVPLLGISGRIGVVSRAARRPEAALQLLLWLAGSHGGTQISAASDATTLFRRSHLKTPGAWVEKPVPPAAAAEYAALVEETCLRQQHLMVLRIPGYQDYLGALDEAVRSAAAGRQSPLEALGQTADQWRKITARLGLERQRLAYRRSLGLE